MAYAAQAAGASTPRLLGTSEIGTEAALLAYEHVDSRPLEDVPDEEIDDDLLRRRSGSRCALLQDQRLAHRRLTGESIHLDQRRPGRAASTPAAARSPPATCCSGSTSPSSSPTWRCASAPSARSAPAAAVIGRRRAGRRAAAAPAHRARPGRPGPRCRQHKELLAAHPRADRRAQAAGRGRGGPAGAVPAAHPGHHHRQRAAPRTSCSPSSARSTCVQVVTAANGRWAGLALVAAVLSYVAAALMLRGFVPEKLPLGPYGAGPVRRVVRQAGRARRRRRRRDQHPLPAETRHPAGAGGGQRGRLPAHRAGLPHRAAAAVRLHHRHPRPPRRSPRRAAWWSCCSPSRCWSWSCSACRRCAGCHHADALAVLRRGAPAARRAAVAPQDARGLRRHPAAHAGVRGLPRRLRPRPSAATLSFTAVAVVFLAGNAIGSAAPTPAAWARSRPSLVARA